MTREQAAAIFDRVMEDMPAASQAAQGALRAMNDAREAYFDETILDTFHWAYELGYKAGREAAQNEP